jgi:hypothetical protein
MKLFLAPTDFAWHSFLATKAQDTSADVSALEREVDELMYALYGLTPDEIKLVQGATK